MTSQENKYRVSSWIDVEELHEVHKNIFSETSSIGDKKKGLSKLQTWKLRTGQDTQSGILCTLILLEVHLKDVTGQIQDRSTLSSLYASSFTKFINYATSFQLNETSMYKSAYKLGIESFLIDLRHLCAHGKVIPSVEVFRRSMKICFGWINNFYWKREIENVSDSNAMEMRTDMKFSQNLQEIFTLYDTMIELMHNGVIFIDDEKTSIIDKLRLNNLEKFMMKFNVKKVSVAKKMLLAALKKIIESQQMTKHSSIFFYEMFENCEYFLTTIADEIEFPAVNESSESEVDLSQSSNQKNRDSVLVLYHQLIWQIARQGYLKDFIRELHVINSRSSDSSVRKISAGFWICTILKSFHYYQQYLQFTKDSWTWHKKITPEVKKIYKYQLDADLQKVFIFVGTQMTQTSLRYSLEYLQQMMKDLNEVTMDVCLSILQFVHPPLSSDQVRQSEELIRIKTQKSATIPLKSSKVFTIDDLIENGEAPMDIDSDDLDDIIWQVSLDDIDWKSQPIGKDVSHLQD